MIDMTMDGAARPERQDAGAAPASTLTQAQWLVIEALAAGKSMIDAAAAGGVSRWTVDRWLKQPEFAAALNRREREVVDAVQRTLLAGLEAAAATVTSATAQGDLKTARWLLERTRALRLPTPTEEEGDPDYLRQRAYERDERRRALRLLDARSRTPTDLITRLAELDDEALQGELRSQPRLTLRLLDQAARIYPELEHALDGELRKAETPASMPDPDATAENDGLRANPDGPQAPAPDGGVEGRPAV